jgi:ABC-type lipoprotein export system ATPase subunit
VSLVEVRDLFRVYPSAEGGVAALQGLTLTVEAGELCVVLGPSGSGKSTLLRIVAGFDRPSAGSVRVAGVDVPSLGPWQAGRFRSRSIGYADQHYWRALAGELTARELVGVQLGLAGVAAGAREARADELLERVGLGDRRGAQPRELSGGEQQRVALCAALAARPALLIADEPTGELDRATAHEVLELIAELVRAEGATALVVSHDPASADRADRVVHVRDGRVSDERLAIAVALANRPQVLFCDEPTGELDRAGSHQVYGALQAVNDRDGTTVVVVTHDPAVQAEVRRTVAIRDGRTSSETLRHRAEGESHHHVTAQEYAVLDRVGRLQLPREFVEALGLRHRVRVELVDDHVEIWPQATEEGTS